MRGGFGSGFQVGPNVGRIPVMADEAVFCVAGSVEVKESLQPTTFTLSVIL